MLYVGSFFSIELILAAKAGNTEIAKLLLAAGASTEHKDKAQNTPLIYAVKYIDADMVSTLLQHGAKITCNVIRQAQEMASTVRQPKLNADRIPNSELNVKIVKLEEDNLKIQSLLNKPEHK